MEESLISKVAAQLPVAAAMLIVVLLMLRWASKERDGDRLERQQERQDRVKERTEFLTTVKQAQDTQKAVSERCHEVHEETIQVIRDNAVALNRSAEQGERLETALVQLMSDVRVSRSAS